MKSPVFREHRWLLQEIEPVGVKCAACVRYVFFSESYEPKQRLKIFVPLIKELRVVVYGVVQQQLCFSAELYTHIFVQFIISFRHADGEMIFSDIVHISGRYCLCAFCDSIACKKRIIRVYSDS